MYKRIKEKTWNMKQEAKKIKACKSRFVYKTKVHMNMLKKQSRTVHTSYITNSISVKQIGHGIYYPISSVQILSSQPKCKAIKQRKNLDNINARGL